MVHVTQPTGRLFISLDVDDLEQAGDVVRDTTDIPEVGGYKPGAILAIRHGLTSTVDMARRYTDKKIIYDHQKAGNDIPRMGSQFMAAVKHAGADAAILFPFVGQATEMDWVRQAFIHGLTPIVGGLMTQKGFLLNEGGSVSKKSAIRIYKRAMAYGVNEFAFPGTRPEASEIINNMLVSGGLNPIRYVIGFGKQCANPDSVLSAFHGPNWNVIVGSAVTGKKDYAEAAKDAITRYLR